MYIHCQNKRYHTLSIYEKPSYKLLSHSLIKDVKVVIFP